MDQSRVYLFSFDKPHKKGNNFFIRISDGQNICPIGKLIRALQITGNLIFLFEDLKAAAISQTLVIGGAKV